MSSCSGSDSSSGGEIPLINLVIHSLSLIGHCADGVLDFYAMIWYFDPTSSEYFVIC